MFRSYVRRVCALRKLDAFGVSTRLGAGARGGVDGKPHRAWLVQEVGLLLRILRVFLKENGSQLSLDRKVCFIKQLWLQSPSR